MTVVPGLRPSPTSTSHYFIDEVHTLPVIAITTSPENLWDWENGIFQLGPDAETEYPFVGANFWKDIEIPIYFEFFVDENKQVEYPLGARTHGGRAARTKPLKPLRLLAKKEFGTEVMEYRFFKELPTEKFKRLLLRNGSGDYGRTYMRDAFLHRYFIKEGLNLDGQADQPVILYLNGAYWGVLHLRERPDERYLNFKYGIDPDNVDLLEEEDFVIEGDFMAFDSMQAYAEQEDLSIDENFEIAASYFDVENITDYLSVQTIVNNFDWPTNNIKYWRERKEGSRWRYLLFDLDVGLGRHGWTTAEANSFARKMGKDSLRVVSVLLNLLENEDYHNYFINRYADLLNSTFRDERFRAEILASRDELEPEMQRHFDRWNGNYDRWKNEYMDELLEYSEDRPPYARQYIIDYFGLENEVLLQLEVEPADGGTIGINTLQPETFPWTGHYFNGVPVQLKAEVAAGFRFSHWETSDGRQFSDATIAQNFEDNTTIKAVFTDQPLAEGLLLSPNPVRNFLILDYYVEGTEEISLEIYDAQGRKLMEEYQMINLGTGNARFQFNVSHLVNGVYFIQLNKGDKQFVERFVKYE